MFCSFCTQRIKTPRWNIVKWLILRLIRIPVFRMCSARISGIFSSIPQRKFWDNTTIKPHRILSNPFKFICHYTIRCYIACDTGNIVKLSISNYKLGLLYVGGSKYQLSITSMPENILCSLDYVPNSIEFFTVCKTDEICWRWKFSIGHPMDRTNWNCRALKTDLIIYIFFK